MILPSGLEENYEPGFNILRESDSAFIHRNSAMPCSDTEPRQALYQFYWTGNRKVDSLDETGDASVYQHDSVWPKIDVQQPKRPKPAMWKPIIVKQ